MEKELNEKTLQDIVKEVALEENMTEEEVMKHIEAFNKLSLNMPKPKSDKQKAKDKSKRKQAKKSRKRNR